MTNYTFRKTEAAELANLTKDYLSGLATPLDGMWESFSGMADQYAIEGAGKVVGYCLINADQQMLQFFMPSGGCRQAFSEAVTELGVTGAVVSTGDAQFLSLSMDNQKSVSVSALLYHDDGKDPIQPVSLPKGTDFRLVTMSELETALGFGVETIGAPLDWLTGYWTNHIGRKELFALWFEGEIISTGERRVSDSQKPYADVGMVVVKDQRKKGIATSVLRQLNQMCRDEGLVAICSTEASNIGAQKAISAAGLNSNHRILDIKF
jgi:GNAT superfamily N-acetyltransferase